MRAVRSQGGPLIGLSTRQLSKWQGAFGRTFAPAGCLYDTDYESACWENEQEASGPWIVSLFRGGEGDAFLISLPCRTALTSSSDPQVLLAQIEYAEDGWDFDKVEEAYFDAATYHQTIEFHFDGSPYWVFDAAAAAEDIGDDRLEFQLKQGLYRIEGGLYMPTEETSLALCRITPVR